MESFVTGVVSVVVMLDGLGFCRLGKGDVGGGVADMDWSRGRSFKKEI